MTLSYPSEQATAEGLCSADLTSSPTDGNESRPNPLPTSNPLRDDEGLSDHRAVRQWIEGYEAAWRKPGTKGLSVLFTDGASYSHSPYEDPAIGIKAITEMWEDDREGPDEAFTLSTEIVAVEGNTAVVRAEVRYGEPVPQEYRDLWLIRFDSDGRCEWFQEWPYWPGHPYSPRDDHGPC